LSSETTSRINGDNLLSGQITSEVAARQAAMNSEVTARNNAISSAIATEVNNRNKAIATEVNNRNEAISTEASTRATTDASLQSQINQLIAPSGEAPSAAEVQNARIGENGVTYQTLGDAIRSQIALLDKSIDADKYAYGIEPDNSGENIINYLLDTSQYEANKYVFNTDGSIRSLSGYNMCVSPYIPVSEGDIVVGTLVSNGAAVDHFGCVYDENKQFICAIRTLSSTGNSQNYTAIMPNRACFVRLTMFTNLSANYFRFLKKRVGWLNKEIVYKTLARKPFSFNGKRAYFAGDSIAYGITDTSQGVVNVHGTGDFPTLFCSAVGAINNNISVSGALYCSGFNESTTIPNQVRSISADAVDVLFIEGGVNDWAFGASPETFATTVQELCDYINTTFSNTLPVIWITPINEAGWRTSVVTKATLQDYRNILTRTILTNDIHARFSVVQGTDFNFPTAEDDSAYIASMFGDDKLHPSALAYKTLYLSGLLNALL